MDLIKFYIFLQIVLVTTAECPRGWNHYENKCYYFSHDMLPWYEASYVCEAHKAHLAVVESDHENDFLQLEAEARIGSFWLGGSDDFFEGNWRWILPDVQLNFTDWAKNQPDNLGNVEDCLILYSIGKYKWYDYPCYATNIKFICEKGLPGSGTDNTWEVLG